jgi:hypothetical protein
MASLEGDAFETIDVGFAAAVWRLPRHLEMRERGVAGTGVVRPIFESARFSKPFSGGLQLTAWLQCGCSDVQSSARETI